MLRHVGEKRLLGLDEFYELRHNVYENTKLYKERIKLWHDRHILVKRFEPRHQVLLYNSRRKLFPRKLKSRWSEPYMVTQEFQHGAI